MHSELVYGLRPSSFSQSVKYVLRILDLVDETVAANPPVDNEKSRFGNPAFRDFYDQVQQVSCPVVIDILTH